MNHSHEIENIFLVGPMGSGKTTIGRQLAKALAKKFFDSDKEIEKRTGATIPWIFTVEGEEGFRKRECEAIDILSHLPNVVLATGGGSVLLPQNRVNLKERGFVIYLRAPLDRLYERTLRDKNRPLLQTEDPKKRLEEIILQREPLYQDVAHLTIETNHLAVRQVVDNICKCLKYRK